MPIDFRKIDSGEDFELLCEALMRTMGFTIVEKVARGPDQGKDIIASKLVADELGFTRTHRFLVECKHHAKGGGSVLEREIGNTIGRMNKHKCDRYILATSTVATEKVQGQLDSLSNAVPHYQATVWHAGDLARRLDQHPDVRERYFPTEPEFPTPAGQLANTVEGLLTVKGFACQSRESAEDRVRLIYTSKEAFARPTAVVCKEGTIDKRDVEALLTEVKDQALSTGVLVTHKIITPAAQDRAAETDGLIQTFTLDAFYRELIDFEPYIRSLTTDYSGSELATYYVDLGCRTVDDSEIKPMDNYVDAWLDDPARNHISILGDYGTGKTSFCRQYAAKLGRRWLADPDRNRIPILISLRDYAKAMNLKQLITDFLVNRYGIQAPYEAFARFNADSKLVLLFDGFDEMAQKVDYRTTVENFEELAKAVVPGSKVVLTCRTSYFRSSEEVRGLFCHENRGVSGAPAPRRVERLPDQPLIDLRDRPNFEIVHLLPFDENDVRAVLQARIRGDWEACWEQIEATYDLRELSQRPVLLDMIVHTLPEIEPSQALNAARLYEAYTGLWLERDVAAMRTFVSPDDKKLFMQELALEMMRREELSIHYSKLPERVREHFNLEKAHELDYFEHDIRTCSFLKRDFGGNYRIADKSFQDFFVAQWLAPRLLDGSAPEMRINEEIRGFVHGLLADADWPPPPEGVEVPEGMVWVPPGPFILGGKYGLVIQVAHLHKGLFVTRTPVTNTEFSRFVQATGYVTVAEQMGGWNPGAGKFEEGFDWRHPDGPSSGIEECPDHPVVQVSWRDAVQYAKWIKGRLLTEQEWEKAARGIDGRIYPWGDTFDPACCNIRASGVGITTSVGLYSPGGDSPCGCVDMAGNVWEWTASEWEWGSERRVLRGGSFVAFAGLARAAYRYGDFLSVRDRPYGFRVCVV